VTEDEMACPTCDELRTGNAAAGAGNPVRRGAGHWLACPQCDRALFVGCPSSLLRMVMRGAKLLSGGPAGMSEPGAVNAIAARFSRDLESDGWLDEFLRAGGRAG
jgi:hypothetical protein